MIRAIGMGIHYNNIIIQLRRTIDIIAGGTRFGISEEFHYCRADSQAHVCIIIIIIIIKSILLLLLLQCYLWMCILEGSLDSGATQTTGRFMLVERVVTVSYCLYYTYT